MAGFWDASAKAVGRWDLQEAGGEVAADSVAARDGVLEAGLSFSTDAQAGPNGWLPSALAFTASGHRIRIPFDAAHNPSAYSIHAWVNGSSSSSFGAVWSSFRFGEGLGGFLVLRSDADTWQHVYGTPSGPFRSYGSEPASPGWASVAVTYDGAASRMFINGVEVASVVAADFLQNSEEDSTIGNIAAGGMVFGGAIAGVSLYDAALTPTEITELRDGPEPTLVSPPTLVGAARAGAPLSIVPGSWQSHGNGSISIERVVQQSSDGLGGWMDVGGNAADPLAEGLVGQYVRVVERATNAGGLGDPAASEAALVAPVASTWRAEARLAVGEFSPARVATLAGAATGQVLETQGE